MKRNALILIALCVLAVSATALPSPAAYFFADYSSRQLRDMVSGKFSVLPASASIGIGGVTGSYLVLKNQEDSFISLGRNFGYQGDFGISFWLRTTPKYQDGGAIVLGRHLAGSYNGYFVMLNSAWGYGAQNKLTFYYSNATVTSLSDVNDGRWHSVTISYRAGSGTELYIDGKLEGKGLPNPILVPDVDFLLGSLSWSKPYGTVTCDLDGLALFSQAMSSYDAAYISANPQWYRGQGWGQGSQPSTPPQQNGQFQQGGSVMRIVLKNGQIISIPTADISRIEF
jgi:hypothetical protein